MSTLSERDLGPNRSELAPAMGTWSGVRAAGLRWSPGPGRGARGPAGLRPAGTAGLRPRTEPGTERHAAGGRRGGTAHRPAGALPDPVLRIELMDINNYGSDASPSLLPSKVGETKYTLMQTLSAVGQARSAARRRHRRRQAGRCAQGRHLGRTGRAHQGHLRRVLPGRRQRTPGASRCCELMARLEQVAQARYAGGLVGQSDAIRAQLEQTAMRAELIALDSEKRQIRAMLNGLLARDGTAPLADPQALRPLPPLTTADAASLAERARARNPQIAGRTGPPGRRAEEPRAHAAQPLPRPHRSACRRRRWARASPPGA